MKPSGDAIQALSLFMGCVLLLAGSGCEPGTPFVPLGHLSVTPDSLSMDIDITGSPYTPRPLTLKGTLSGIGPEGAFIGASFTTEGLRDASVTLSNPFTVTVTPKSASALGNGTFKDVVFVYACADVNCKHHYEGSPASVPVTYRVESHLTIDASITREAFASTVGTSQQNYFSFEVNGNSALDWTAVANPSWIKLDTTSGRSPSRVYVILEPSELPVGFHSGEIQFTETATNKTHTVPIKVERRLPAFTVSVPGLSFGGPAGRTYVPAQLKLWLGTEKAYPWTASIDTGNGPQWLSLSSESGTLSHQGGTLTASVNPSGLAAGDYTGSITFSTIVEGNKLTQVVPVSLKVDSHRLNVTDNGVALVSLPTVSQLTTSVSVRDNFGMTTTPWTASSNQDWLSVTASGTSGGTLTVTANPAGLAPDTFHQATVTLRSSDPTVVNQEVLQVGLWVGSSAPVSELSFPSYRTVETDPIRPWMYVHDGSSIHVIHLYTGQRVTSFRPVPTTLFGAMLVSGDGSTLYVWSNGKLWPISLSTFSAGTGWAIDTQPLVYARPDGMGILLASNGTAYNATTGLAYPGRFEPRLLSLARDTSQFCSVNHCAIRGCDPLFNPHIISCSRLSYSEGGSGTLGMTVFSSVSTGGNPPKELAVSNDGSRVYVSIIMDGQRGFRVLSGDRLQLLRTLEIGDAIPTGVEVGPDDRFYGFGEVRTGTKDVWAYDTEDRELGSFWLGGDQGIWKHKLSGDGKRLVVSNPSGLKIVTTP